MLWRLYASTCVAFNDRCSGTGFQAVCEVTHLEYSPASSDGRLGINLRQTVVQTFNSNQMKKNTLSNWWFYRIYNDTQLWNTSQVSKVGKRNMFFFCFIRFAVNWLIAALIISLHIETKEQLWCRKEIKYRFIGKRSSCWNPVWTSTFEPLLSCILIVDMNSCAVVLSCDYVLDWDLFSRKTEFLAFFLPLTHNSPPMLAFSRIFRSLKSTSMNEESGVSWRSPAWGITDVHHVGMFIKRN